MKQIKMGTVKEIQYIMLMTQTCLIAVVTHLFLSMTKAAEQEPKTLVVISTYSSAGRVMSIIDTQAAIPAAY